MDVKLVVFKANGQRREYPISAAQVTVGRGTDCELQIPLGIVSRKHCRFSIKEDTLTLKDLGSSNGTYVNEKRVQETTLKAGDLVVVGPVIFTVLIDGQPENIKPVRTVIVEHAVEPVAQAESQGAGTVDVEAEEESGAGVEDPLAALQAMSKKARK